jgi:hypothetical protein
MLFDAEDAPEDAAPPTGGGGPKPTPTPGKKPTLKVIK